MLHKFLQQYKRKVTDKTIIEFAYRTFSNIRYYGDHSFAVWNSSVNSKAEMNCYIRSHYNDWLKTYNIDINNDYDWPWYCMAYFNVLINGDIKLGKHLLSEVIATKYMWGEYMFYGIIHNPLVTIDTLYEYLSTEKLEQIENDLPNLNEYKKMLISFVIEENQKLLTHRYIEYFFDTQWQQLFNKSEQDKLLNSLLEILIKSFNDVYIYRQLPDLFTKLLNTINNINVENLDKLNNVFKIIRRKRINLDQQIELLKLLKEYGYCPENEYDKIMARKMLNKI